MSRSVCRSGFTVGLVCFASVFASTSSTVGQVVQIKSLRDQVSESIRQQTQLYQRQMEIAVAEIDRLCDLTDEQEKRLSVAAKGAIEEALLPRSANFAAATDTPKEIDEIIDARVKAEEKRILDVLKQADKLQESGVELPWGALGVTVTAVADDAAIGSDRWKTSIEQILSPAQAKRYTQAKKLRQEKVQSARVQLVLAQLDELLLMDDEQMKKMESLLHEVMKQNSTARMLLTGSPSFFSQRIHMIPYTQAKEFLAEDQLRHWRAIATGYNRIQR